MAATVACYREFAPCEALREHVRAFFSFGPATERVPGARQLIREVRLADGERRYSPLLADGHASLSFRFEQLCRCGGSWRHAFSAPRGEAIGPMTSALGPAPEQQPEAAGAFLLAGHARAILGVSPAEIADRVVSIDELWGAAAAGLPSQLAELDETERIDWLERLLLRRLAQARTPDVLLNVSAMARSIQRARGCIGIERLAFEAGVSRQHLTRSFRDAVGISPKRFARLMRFHAGLVYAGCGGKVDWAQVALDLGYADQSHMIAEFREFSSFTPEILAREGWFHPFIERARASGGRAYSRFNCQDTP